MSRLNLLKSGFVSILVILSIAFAIAESEESNIIAYFNKRGELVESKETSYCYRILLDENDVDGLLIQDYFSKNDHKQIDPIYITNKQDLKRAEPSSFNGILTHWNENKNRVSSYEMLKGQANGLGTEWYEAGQKKSEVYYMDGVMNGSIIQWHENGNKMFEGKFVAGEKEGKVSFWHKDGTPKEELHYQKGILHGPYVLWYENGHKKNEGAFSNNEEEGPWNYWDQDGKKTNEVLFNKGEISEFKSL